MMAPDPLDNNRNWVRAAMGLKYLKEGLESFVENEIANLQTSFLNDICNYHGLPPTTTCSLCKLENVLPCPTKGYCYTKKGICNIHKPGVAYPNCPNNLCNNIASKIVDQHRYPRRPTGKSPFNHEAPSWKNTDVSKWCSSSWEIAKCFMAPTGYADKLTVKQTDCTGILSVIINCQAIQSALSTVIDPKNDIFSKMRDIRNTIVHSATLEVKDADLQQYIDDMIAILNDGKTIQNHPDAGKARTKLNEIKANTFVISARDVLDLRKKAVEAIEKKQKELEDQCQQVQHDIETKANETLASLSQAGISCQKKLEEKLEEVELKSKQTQSTVDQKINSLTQTHAIIEKKQKYLQSKCDQTMTTLAQAERQCQQKQDDIQSSLTSLQAQMKQVIEIKANTFVISARDVLDLRKKAVEAIEKKQKELEDQCQQVQHDIETKANETLASLSQAGISCQKKLEEKLEEVELKSKQTQSTVDQKINSLTQTHAIIEKKQKYLQSKCDQTMTTLAQAERQCQQKQDDIQSSLTSLQAQMKQVIEDLRQCQQDIIEVRDLQKGTDKHEEQVKILENVLEQRQRSSAQ